MTSSCRAHKLRPREEKDKWLLESGNWSRLVFHWKFNKASKCSAFIGGTYCFLLNFPKSPNNVSMVTVEQKVGGEGLPYHLSFTLHSQTMHGRLTEQNMA